MAHEHAAIGVGGVTLGEALEAAVRILAASGIEDPRREARLLAGHALGVPAGGLLDLGCAIDGDVMTGLVDRRAAREPLAFITGRRGFWTLDLAVTPDTLIPRPDSETLIEAAIAAFPQRERVGLVLDLGTGTGALLLAALVEFPRAYGVGSDISPPATALAMRNAAANGLSGRAGFVAADWGAPLGGRFDLILCNPPYIPSAEIAGLMPEVAGYEPRRALDGGADGLDDYRRLIVVLPGLLAPGGAAILEIGADQLEDVAGLAAAAGYPHVTWRADLSGVPRALIVQGIEGPLKKPFGSSFVGS